ncbi:hypothetical protein Patl1_35613 [Pistacia atlantica]|nr:hypothetical protein Patl1_35613 [Pistacia atlantica]
MILFPKVLDETNYVMWKRSMLISLSAKNKLGFIKGTVITPNEKDPKYFLWQHCNAMIFKNDSLKVIFLIIIKLNDPLLN